MTLIHVCLLPLHWLIYGPIPFTYKEKQSWQNRVFYNLSTLRPILIHGTCKEVAIIIDTNIFDSVHEQRDDLESDPFQRHSNVLRATRVVESKQTAA